MGTSRSSPLAAVPLWAAAAAALAVPWAVMPWLRDDLGLPKSVLAAAAAAAGGLGWAAAGAPSLAVGVEAPLAAFSLCAVASAALSVDPSGSLYGVDLDPLSSLAGLATVLAGFYLGAAAGRASQDAPRRLNIALVLGAVPVALLALAQVAVPHPLPYFELFTPGRAQGLFGHPVALGSYLAMVVPVALSAAVSARGVPRAAAAAAAILAAAGLAASVSRGAWVGAGAGAGLVLVLHGRPWARQAALFCCTVALAATLVATARIDAVGSRPAGTRLPALGVAWKAFKENPVLGSGPGLFGLAYRRHRGPELEAVYPGTVFPHAHNDWAEVLAALGLVGLAAYAWLHAAALRAALRPGPCRAAAGALVALFVFAKTNLPCLPVAFLAALLGGAALGAKPPSLPGRAASTCAAALFLAGVLWGGWAGARRLPAERQAFLGRLARRHGRPREAASRLEAAVRGVPESIPFRLDLVNLLWDAASAAPPSERRTLLEGARDAALAGARLRPAEPEFLRLLALAELRRARWSGADSLPAALSALEAARSLDPLDRRLGALAQAIADPAAESLPPGF